MIKVLFDLDLELVKVSHHFSKFIGYGHYGIGDKIAKVCHVISQDHKIKGSCDFMGESPSW